MIRKVSFKSPSPNRPKRPTDPTPAVANSPDARSSRQDPGYIARRSARSASPPRRSRSPLTNRVRVNISSRTGDSNKGGEIDDKAKATTAQLEKGWNSSWSQEDRDRIWEREVRVDRGISLDADGSKDKSPVGTNSAGRKKLTAYSGQFRKKRNKKSDSSWKPPSISELDQQAVKTEHLPPILPPQQSAIRDWLYSIGLSVRDGEGGFIHWSGSSGASLPPLKEDRLRNGELLCDLVALLEPNAATHAQLMQLVNRKPATIALAMENIERALWLLRIRKCPPISQAYLCQPMAIIEAHKPLLWGLLQEIKQAYPSAGGSAGKSSVSLQPDLSISKASGWCNSLPYSIADRKALDQSLMHWLVEEEILSGIMKGLLPADMPSIATLEGPLRDGTMLCLLAGKILGSPVMGWNRKARSFSTSVSNLKKCTQALRSNPSMGLRFLYSGVEEDIAKGEWAAILGLLEDMHRLRDGVSPIPYDKSANSDRRKVSRSPYLGHVSQEWPPPMHPSEAIGGNRRFTVQSVETRVRNAVDLSHNIPSSTLHQDTSSSRRQHVGGPSMRWEVTANSAVEGGPRGNLDVFPGHDVHPRKVQNEAVQQEATATEFEYDRERLAARGEVDGTDGITVSGRCGDIVPGGRSSTSKSMSISKSHGQRSTEENIEDNERNVVRDLRMQYHQQQHLQTRRHGDVVPTEADSQGYTSPSSPREVYSEPHWANKPPASDIAPGIFETPQFCYDYSCLHS